jgi:hypothetical protein
MAGPSNSRSRRSASSAKVVVCNPRKNALLKAGNKSDRIDAYLSFAASQ